MSHRHRPTLKDQFPHLDKRQRVAIRRIRRLYREVERELSYWTVPDCVAKIDEAETLMRTHFPLDWAIARPQNEVSTGRQMGGSPYGQVRQTMVSCG